MHLREDRRHIWDSDIQRARKQIVAPKSRDGLHPGDDRLRTRAQAALCLSSP